tara:strand:+ start:3040 stop:3639 length:600 start_codon:yes stop_codon:yes gene_type:complete
MATLNKFGVPIDGTTGRGGILQPKLKYRFRVRFTGFGNLGSTQVDLTQQVMNITRPKVTHEEVPVHVYNSVAYLMGKHTWEPVTITLRDDITNSISKLAGQQVQKQLNHFEQTAPTSGISYKFNTRIEILDGTNDAELEQWVLENCFLQNVDYSDGDYAVSEPVQVIMTLRYDNATHFDTGGGEIFPLSPIAQTGGETI